MGLFLARVRPLFNCYLSSVFILNFFIVNFVVNMLLGEIFPASVHNTSKLLR